MNPFDQLLVPLFPSICQCLRLRDKCLIFPVLSKSINRMFDVKKCCQNDISIHLSGRNINDHPKIRSNTIKQFGFIGHAQTISLIIEELAKRAPASQSNAPSAEQSVEFFDELARHIKQAIFNGSLSSLCIKENHINALSTIWTRIIDSLAGTDLLITQNIDQSITSPTMPIMLRDIRLDIKGLSDADWTGLKHCKCLTVFHLYVTSTIMVTSKLKTAGLLLSSLPDSIEDVILRADEDSDLLPKWTTALLSNTFAPNLKRFIVQQFKGWSRATAQSIVETTMVQTGTIRPIEFWVILDGHKLVQQLPLKHIMIRCDDTRADVFDFDCPHAWPQLQRMHATMINKNDNALSLLTLLSGRPIIEFQLSCNHENLPLDGKAMLLLACISSLVCLKLSFDPTPPFACLNSGCWSQLEVLQLRLPVISEDEIIMLLKAAPFCKQVDFDVTNIAPVFMLAIIGCFCPLVVRIDISSDSTHLEHVDDVREIFERYSSNHPFGRLVHLSMHANRCCNAALHYLIKLLAGAPQLRWVKLHGLDGILPVVMLRELPHLVTLHDMITIVADPSFKQELIVQCIEWRQSDTSIFATGLVRRGSGTLRRATAHDDITAEWFQSQQTYPIFAGSSGRQMFFDWMYMRLNSWQKQLLQRWDAAEYSQCCVELAD